MMRKSTGTGAHGAAGQAHRDHRGDAARPAAQSHPSAQRGRPPPRARRPAPGHRAPARLHRGRDRRGARALPVAHQPADRPAGQPRPGGQGRGRRRPPDPARPAHRGGQGAAPPDRRDAGGRPAQTLGAPGRRRARDRVPRDGAARRRREANEAGGRGMTGTDVGGAPVVDLHEVRRDMGGLVGGKAANLGEMAAAGERVPPGFCVTTAAYAAGEVPAEAVAEAYARMGGGPVAVRSSATAEDLPDASFAGQQDTYLGVEGADAVVDAVRRCWASLDNERATAYREANEIDRAGVRMAVVVQRMVDAATAGVMFTADPITGSRARTVVDAVRGLGTAVVDGSTEPDHYVLGGDEGPGGAGGCLTAGQLKELGAAGRRLQGRFGAPQDAEGAYDADGLLWPPQARPLPARLRLPPRAPPGSHRLYLEAGHLQGRLRPFPPMGMSMIQEVWGGWCAAVGVRIDPHEPGGLLAHIGRRFYR